MSQSKPFSKYLYWFSKAELEQAKPVIRAAGIKLAGVIKTPCEVLKASGNKALYASPTIWSTLCKRQGSWYRASDRAGKYMVISEQRLPESCDQYIDSEISAADFTPEALPNRKQLIGLVESDKYQNQRPDEWELPGMKDSLMFKIMFTFTGFWGWGDNLKSHWVNHKANHANFLSKHFTTKVDGEDVPYSVTNNDGVCSSCVEFFNVIEQSDRKLVRACPGSITFAHLERERYYDVKPINIPVIVQ